MIVRTERAGRPGFTLVEVMVALLVSAVVVLGARTLLEQLGDSAQRTVAAARLADRTANGDRMLRDLAGRLDMGGEGTARFSGEPTTTSFRSWCDRPSGWQERCAVTLVVREARGRSLLVGILAPGDSVILLDRGTPIELRYLIDQRSGGRWFSNWGAGITAPLALAVISGSDTMIVRIGDRG